MAKVLVVEDERIVAKDLERTLMRLGHNVPGMAASADDAIRMAEEHHPDLVLMDIHLTGARDGISAASEVRARLDIPVVYLTAFADDDTVSRARETEPFGYLVKPFNERELHSTVEVALHKHRTEARLRLQDRMMSLGAMAAGVAHEINNPLTFVTANLGFISTEIAQAATEIEALPVARSATIALLARLRNAAQAIDDAAEGAERVRTIVADLKVFARPDDVTRSRVDLWQVIESALRMVASHLRHRAAIVREQGAVPLVHANAARLEQVFMNLLVNAAQAIPEGDMKRHQVRVTTLTDAQGRAVVEVADTGKGIAPEDLIHIFEPFFTTKPIGIGTGLGLSLCRSILTELGGDILAESARGRGTVFRITLPQAPAELPPPSAVKASIAAGSVPRARILTVDDEPFFGRLMQRILSPAHDVLSAASGAEALVRFKAGERFDLVFCDLMMPEMNGMDLFEAVRALAPDQADRFVFLSGGATTPRSAAFLEAFEGRQVAKPFTTEQIVEIVEAQLRKGD